MGWLCNDNRRNFFAAADSFHISPPVFVGRKNNNLARSLSVSTTSNVPLVDVLTKTEHHLRKQSIQALRRPVYTIQSGKGRIFWQLPCQGSTENLSGRFGQSLPWWQAVWCNSFWCTGPRVKYTVALGSTPTLERAIAFCRSYEAARKTSETLNFSSAISSVW